MEERDILKRHAVLYNRVRLKYRLINNHRDVWWITALCRVLKVARERFYVWLHCSVSAREKDNYSRTRRHSHLGSVRSEAIEKASPFIQKRLLDSVPPQNSNDQHKLRNVQTSFM